MERTSSKSHPPKTLSSEDANASKKQREIYVGNLAQGADVVIGALFDEALGRLFPDLAQKGPPVIRVNIDPTRKFGFVEFRSAFLAHAATTLDKTEVGGRAINIGRPKGYVEVRVGHVHDRTPVRIERPYELIGFEVSRLAK